MEGKKAQQNRIFILDIGTRSVVGVAGHREGELFVVEASAIEPHSRRAMIDGQIEDIEQVAKVAGAVKTRIEDKLGLTFHQVGVAAAGRALKTCRASATAQLPAGVAITAQTAYGLENAAINEARLALDVQGEEVPYYCVGHSVVRYTLDGYPFTTIVGHRAAVAEVEIIATFLPAEVVESLRRCMELLDLEIDTMTLEPIAAMRAVIPQDLRLLNLALVDIGAGTSDIALSANGSVSGYTMATVAGDEVTETIIRKFLVDFATAERIKMGIGEADEVAYTDILGFEQKTTRAEVLETIAPAVETVAQVIADRITDTNAGAPAAVFMVGGGSKTPGLCAQLAEKLGLPENRAALAGTDFSGKLLNEDSGLDGPEFATPVGIALIMADNSEVEGAAVSINGRKVRLFTPASTSVMDALLIGGYTYSDLMGRNGRSLVFTLNGLRTVVRGEPYTAAELIVNGKPASLSTPVENGDAIDITPATSGADAVAFIADYAKEGRPIRVTLNGEGLLAGLIARVNGAVAIPDTAIHEQDAVELYLVRTVGELCDAADLPLDGATVTVNGQPAGPDHTLHDADDIVCEAGAPTTQKAAPEEAEPAPEEPAKAAEKPEKPETAGESPALPKPGMAQLRPQTVTPKPQPAAPPEEEEAEPERPVITARVTEPPKLHDRPPVAPAPVPEPELPEEPELPKEPEPEKEPELKTEPGPKPEKEPEPDETPEPEPPQAPPPAPAPKETPPPKSPPPAAPAPAAGVPSGRSLRIELNGKTVVLPPKPGGEPHRLFDMLALVDIDPQNPKGMVKVLVNGAEAPYLEQLVSGDVVEIGWQ